jgi:transposase-like protein
MRWSKRDLTAKRYVYFWVDGIHVQARLEDAAQRLLVIVGATPDGRRTENCCATLLGVLSGGWCDLAILLK